MLRFFCLPKKVNYLSLPHPQQSLSDLVDVARFALVAAFLEDAFSLAFCLFFAIQSLLLFGNCSICKKGRLYTGC